MGGALCLSPPKNAWKTFLVDQRCPFGRLSMMVIKHRICKNTITYAIYGISQVCKNFSFIMLMLAGAILEASELRGEPPLALHRSGLTWNHLPGGQVSSPGHSLSHSSWFPNEPGSPNSQLFAWLLLIQLVKEKSWARLGFSMDFVDFIFLQIF